MDSEKQADPFDALHPAVKDVLRFFECAHLASPQYEVAKAFRDLARGLAIDPNTSGPQLTISLQLLLQSKDAAVRASL